MPSFLGDPLNDAALFFVGAFLCNCMPHLAAGLMGIPFPTPFASPRGVGSSRPVINFLWGAANFAVGLYLLRTHPFALGQNIETASVAAGALLLGLYLSLHFGRLRSKA